MNIITEEEANNIIIGHNINLKKVRIKKWIKENQEELEFSFYNLLELLKFHKIYHRKIKFYSWAKFCYKNSSENKHNRLKLESLDEIKFNYTYTSD